jgi:hypothetical protein
MRARGDTVTTDELEQQTARQLDALRRELEGSGRTRQVTLVGGRHLERLRRDATVTEFIPLLVYRFTKEELVDGTREELPDSA